MNRLNVWDSTSKDTPRGEWCSLLCRRADFTGKLWPTGREELYAEGLTIDEAMKKTYPDWKKPYSKYDSPAETWDHP